MSGHNSITRCVICHEELEEPYIKCAQCTSELCLECFSNGAETFYHRNTHSYIIFHDKIEVFPSSNWTGAEEKLLLNLLLVNGYGNWESISKGMKNKTPDECRKHYHHYYFDNIFKDLLGLTNEYYFPIKNPYMPKTKSSDPPRCDADPNNFKNMAGYRSARGDFEIPFDSSAENIVKCLQVNDWPNEMKNIRDQLHIAILKSYNHRLMERHRRYKIMRHHGLLMANKTLGWLSAYSDSLGASQKDGHGKLPGGFLSFMQLTIGCNFDLLVEFLQKFNKLKKYLYKLYDMRLNGIKTFHAGNLYLKLSNNRNSSIRKAQFSDSNLNFKKIIPQYNTIGKNKTWLSYKTAYPCSQTRRKASPINIIGLSGYEKLSDDERTLCSVTRIIPAAYLEYKDILVSENSKAGFLRLADARRLVKIDVNKTRQVYDFLIKNGFINRPF